MSVYFGPKKTGWPHETTCPYCLTTGGHAPVCEFNGPNSPREPTAPDMLAKAKQHMEDRAATYDSPTGERSMGKAVAAFNAITGRDMTEPEGWLLLQVLKDVRLFQRPGYHADSAEDCISYAALKAEAKAHERGPK